MQALCKTSLQNVGPCGTLCKLGLIKWNVESYFTQSNTNVDSSSQSQNKNVESFFTLTNWNVEIYLRDLFDPKKNTFLATHFHPMRYAIQFLNTKHSDQEYHGVLYSNQARNWISSLVIRIEKWVHTESETFILVQ